MIDAHASKEIKKVTDCFYGAKNKDSLRLARGRRESVENPVGALLAAPFFHSVVIL